MVGNAATAYLDAANWNRLAEDVSVSERALAVGLGNEVVLLREHLEAVRELLGR